MMKTVMKRIASVILGAALAVSCAACNSAAGTSSSAGQSATASEENKSAKIGIIQYATHPSLDNCYTGFIQGLEEAGYKEGENLEIEFQNAQGEMSNSDLIAKNMVSKKYDMVVGIATPAAMSAYAATKSAGIPVVFTAVSDAVSAGIVKSNDKSGTNCAGSSDVLPLEEQIKMIRSFLPDAKKIGIIYTTSEPNSVSQLKEFKEIAVNYDFEVIDVGVTNASEVAAAVSTAISRGADCINNFTDNNVVNNLSTVLQKANEAKIPVFGSEEEQVKNGCLASQSIDYIALGKETGKMAAQILNGEKKPEDMAVFMVKDFAPVYNKEVMETLGLTLPSDLSSATEVGAAN